MFINLFTDYLEVNFSYIAYAVDPTVVFGQLGLRRRIQLQSTRSITKTTQNFDSLAIVL